jgi:5-methylthioribose kinase
MLELNAANTLDYLRAMHWIGSGPARVEVLGGGVSNVVLRVITADDRIVLKQSRPQLRTRDAWFSDLDRVYREQEVMQLLYPLLLQPTVPCVRFTDRANYVFAMSHAPEDSRVWKETLLAGQVNLTVAARAGRVLATIHEETARRASQMESLANPTVFIQLRVDPFYRKIQERRPEVARAVGRVVDQMLGIREALCHGDYSPKNILTHSRGFTLVDYETAHLGDPTMDLGFFLSHLMLKALRHVDRRHEFFELTRTFWRSYGGAVTFRPAAELEVRAVGHFACCYLARIDGTSPVEYLPEEPRREAVRRLARDILEEMPNRWEQVLEYCEAEYARL